jgi:hypothetical protein
MMRMRLENQGSRRFRALQFACLHERRRPDSNRGIKVLQTSALPLGYGAAVLVASSVPAQEGNSKDHEGENSTLTARLNGGKVYHRVSLVLVVCYDPNRKSLKEHHHVNKPGSTRRD